jgi:hypothetical protein
MRDERNEKTCLQSYLYMQNTVFNVNDSFEINGEKGIIKGYEEPAPFIYGVSEARSGPGMAACRTGRPGSEL